MIPMAAIERRDPGLSLSVVIPAYNEAHRLPATIETVAGYLAGRCREWEIVVVDDGSTDGTAALLAARADGERLIVCRLERNRGKGAAVRAGVARCRHDYVLVTDADLSTPISALDTLWRALQGADVAIGSRAVDRSLVVRAQPRYRTALGRLFNRLARALRLTPFADTQCGFKLWRREAARQVFARSRIDGFAFDVESLLIARKLGCRVAEAAVPWSNDPDSRVCLFPHLLLVPAELAMIVCNNLSGRYDSPPKAHREERKKR